MWQGHNCAETKEQREAYTGLSGFEDEFPQAGECLELGFCSQMYLAPWGDARRKAAPWETGRAGAYEETGNTVGGPKSQTLQGKR